MVFGYKLYVNCRPLLRIFKEFKDNGERSINNFVIYISRFDTNKFTNAISLYSMKLQKLVLGSRRDSDYTEIV